MSGSHPSPLRRERTRLQEVLTNSLDGPRMSVSVPIWVATMYQKPRADAIRIEGQPEPTPWYEPFMIAICATVFLAALQQERSPFESRLPQHREHLLERGGGSKETEAAVQKALEWLVKNQKAD